MAHLALLVLLLDPPFLSLSSSLASDDDGWGPVATALLLVIG